MNSKDENFTYSKNDINDEVDALETPESFGLANPLKPIHPPPSLPSPNFDHHLSPQVVAENISWTSIPRPIRRRRYGSNRLTHDPYFKSTAINILFILAWYFFATLLSLYNKWMFSPEHFNFNFPLFVTSTHMLMQFILSGCTMSIIPSLRPKRLPTLWDYTTKAVPCGISTGLDIGLSNASLQTITLSFYTMCKSSSLGFVLAFAFLFKIEKPTWPLAGIISLISLGVFLMVMTETKFQLVGFIEVFTASAMGGLRWSLTQILLAREKMGMDNPIATAFILAPIMFISLTICAASIEGYGNIFASHFFQSGEFSKTIGLMALPGVLAFFMVLCEFNLLKRTSVVTLSIAGIFKEVATILLSSVIFGDELRIVNGIGLAITLFGIALYNYLKYRELRSKSKRQIDDEEADDLLANDESDLDAQEIHTDPNLIKRNSNDFLFHKRRSIAFYNQALESTAVLDPGANFASMTTEYDELSDEDEGIEDATISMPLTIR